MRHEYEDFLFFNSSLVLWPETGFTYQTSKQKRSFVVSKNNEENRILIVKQHLRMSLEGILPFKGW